MCSIEVMEEYKVTVDGVTRTVGKPFHVIATQNPQGSAGTQSLPEAQMDRFMILLSLGYPDYDSELAMAKAVSAEDKYSQLMPVLTKENLSMLQNEIHDIYISDGIYRYILDLVTATRNNPYLEKGASPRATIYASGFRVPSEAFTKLENGNYFAEVTDEHAHAWTEIFIENYGWTPIEVTPAGDGISMMPSFEFFSIQGITINDEEEAHKKGIMY